jgi:putative phosphoesterase
MEVIKGLHPKKVKKSLTLSSGLSKTEASGMNAPLRLQIPEIDASCCMFGSEVLSKLLQAFEAQIDGVLESEDIEYVHKMRVISRRIRAVMPLFRTCYPKKKFKKWFGEVKKVTRLLGEARDLDVQIAFMQAYLQKLNAPTERVGLEPLLKSHKNRRKAIQATMTSGLEELQSSAVLKEMSAFCEKNIEELAKLPFVASCVLEKAYWHTSSRLEDFLVSEAYVHKESAILKHHEMRIKAKWLRYTMEAFAPLYKNELSEEIRTIKAFQDVLGEMHDCDVWIDYLPKVIAKSRVENTQKKKVITVTAAECKRALLRFLTYIKETKKTYYIQFVRLWDENKATNFFDKLLETANGGFSLGENKIDPVLLSNPNVKIAVLADVHANLHALETVFQDAEKRGANVFLNAGDSIGFGAFPNEVIELLRTKNVVSVVGNVDLEVIKGGTKDKRAKKIVLEFAKKELRKSCDVHLLSFPFAVSLEAAGKKLLMVHGSPESLEEPIYHDTPVKRLEMLAEEAKADLIIMGHSHEQFHRKIHGVSFVNPGSVGRPGDGNPQTAYAMLSFDHFQVKLIRLDYDVEAAVDALRKKKLPESFAQMLLRGLPLEDIVKEDKARKDDMVQDCEKLVQISQSISKTYGQSAEHFEQVRKLALCFFDGLKRMHQLGKRERCWLDCAAILHDIGLSEGTKGHHKTSMRLILNDTHLPFTSEEKRIVASIARYHRKALPSQKHYNLAALNETVVAKITFLASLLRVADALDYSHTSVVKTVNFKFSPKKVTVECVASSDSSLEEPAFNKKKDLLERVFEKKLVLLWTQQ